MCKHDSQLNLNVGNAQMVLVSYWQACNKNNKKSINHFVMGWQFSVAPVLSTGIKLQLQLFYSPSSSCRTRTGTVTFLFLRLELELEL